MQCEDNRGDHLGKEAFELTFANTHINTQVKQNNVKVHVVSKLIGTVGELKCSKLDSESAEKAFENRISTEVKKNMQLVIDHLQTKQIDAIGIGNKIFAKNPQLWKVWQKNWNERFADVDFTFEFEVEVLHTGSSVGKPSSK